MNNATPIVIIIVLIILAVVAFFMFTGPETDDINLDIDQATTTLQQNQDTDQEPTTWRTYTNDQFDFTFTYPSDAQTEIEAGRAVVTFLGPDNTPNSEISDGFTFSVDTEARSDDVTLQAFAQEKFEDETGTLTAVTNPRSITLGNRSAYEFSVESELGPTVTHVLLEGDDATVIHVMYMVMDPGAKQYQQMVNTMLQSLQYTGETEDIESTTTPATVQ